MIIVPFLGVSFLDYLRPMFFENLYQKYFRFGLLMNFFNLLILLWLVRLHFGNTRTSLKINIKQGLQDDSRGRFSEGSNDLETVDIRCVDSGTQRQNSGSDHKDPMFNHPCGSDDSLLQNTTQEESLLYSSDSSSKSSNNDQKIKVKYGVIEHNTLPLTSRKVR